MINEVGLVGLVPDDVDVVVCVKVDDADVVPHSSIPGRVKLPVEAS